MAQERREVSVTIKVQHNGYGADITAECLVEHIPGLIARLAEHGVTPANSPYVWEVGKSGNVSKEKNSAPNDAPVCRHHGTPMKPSKKGNGWFCPRKLDDGNYCKERTA